MPRCKRSALSVPAVVACVLGSLAVPAGASGATAAVSGSTLTFTASGGEQNDLVVEADGAVFRVIDNTAPVTAGASCSQRSVHRVSCVSAGVDLVRALLFDGDDSAVTLIGTTDAELLGGSGADNLTSSGGDDTLRAGKSRQNQADFLISGGGTDTLIGSPTGTGQTLLLAGPGDDQLLGGESNDTLFGDTGADLLDGGEGSDFVNWAGPPGVTVTVDAGANDGAPGEGDDVENVEFVSGTEAADNITGTVGSQTLEGNGGNDTLAAAGGNDSLIGGDNADTLSGGGGVDDLRGDKRADDISGGAGIDTVEYFDHAQSVNVTINNVANDGSSGGAEGDNVHTDVENLAGTDFNDTLIGSAQENTITGDDGNDNIQGAGGDDELFGDQTFTSSSSGNDDLAGGDGDDALYGGAGADDYAGGPDIDVADYSRASAPGVTVTVDNVANDGTGGGAEGDNVMDTVENVTGTTLADMITGSAAANTLLGGQGADELHGGDGPDLLDGETPGAFIFSFDPDIFDGGPGNDTASYVSHFGGVTVDIGGAPDGVGGGTEGDDVQSTIENLIGSSGSDTLTGNAQANTIAGRDGTDLLIGGASGDSLIGGPGFDTHEGQAGKDEINSRGDGTTDVDNCGTEADTAIRDGVDTVNADCETLIP